MQVLGLQDKAHTLFQGQGLYHALKRQGGLEYGKQ